MILQKFATAEAIARFLKGAGIKGSRGHRTCPIAQYVQLLYPHAAEVWSSTGSITVWFTLSSKNAVFLEIPTTEAMNDFIIRFDCGLFPQVTRV